jgi:hypothetical protein
MLGGRTWFGALKNGPESAATNLQSILGALRGASTRAVHPWRIFTANKRLI